MDKRGRFKRTEEMNRRMSETLKGRKFSEQHIERLRLASTGRKHSKTTKRKMSLMRRGTQVGIKNNFFGRKHSQKFIDSVSGKNSRNWKGGIYPENRRLRKIPEYKQWRKQVFERDGYTCQECHKIGGDIEADHIKQFAYYPKLRYRVSNGRTLCKDCHRKTPTFAKKL